MARWTARLLHGLILLGFASVSVPGHAQADADTSVPDAVLLSELPDAPSAILTQQSAPPNPTQQPSQSTIVPADETEEQRKARLHAEGEREVKTQEQQRIMAVVPNFNTVLNGRGVALSKGQKTRLAVRATFDPFNAVSSFLLAGLSELGDTHDGYGWGPGGYFKRVGANGADIIDSTMLAGAVYPILLHQDPRYFRQGTGSIGSRTRHALFAAFICLGDNGKRQPNYSNVLGNLTAGLISNLYYPSDETGVRLSLQNSSIVTLEGALGNLGLEFSPDVQRWLHRKKLAPKAD